ncbi:hypothetical protein CHL78_009050 [Romboutsia weinsteinii]|uniref:Uncharacterized protein n=1 Tax=Romboutsia weinsteinii TaxID=2020949 RepID=A0A371J492_9FIRM|nr:hypothetical protein CHL78_009050 [Romboutsia weinsteinii]
MRTAKQLKKLRIIFVTNSAVLIFIYFVIVIKSDTNVDTNNIKKTTIVRNYNTKIQKSSNTIVLGQCTMGLNVA